MKIGLYAVNTLALIVCVYGYVGQVLTQASYVAVYLALTTFALGDWSARSFRRIMMFVNICASCVIPIVMVALLINGEGGHAALSLPVSLSVLLALMIVAVLNLVQLVNMQRRTSS